jgi:hypothetical protein
LHRSQLEDAEEAPSESGRKEIISLQYEQISFAAAVELDLQRKQITNPVGRNWYGPIERRAAVAVHGADQHW